MTREYTRLLEEERQQREDARISREKLPAAPPDATRKDCYCNEIWCPRCYPPIEPVAEPSKPTTLCDTTMTHRAPRTACHCDTYPENLGPCATFLGGMKEDYCAYCDHNSSCHRAHWGAKSTPARSQIAEPSKLEGDATYTECSSRAGIVVGLVDAVIAIAQTWNKLLTHPMPDDPAVIAAFKDMRASKDVREFFGITDFEALAAEMRADFPSKLEGRTEPTPGHDGGRHGISWSGSSPQPRCTCNDTYEIGSGDRCPVHVSPQPQEGGTEAVNDYGNGFIDGREFGYAHCGGCEHPWEAHDGECGAYMKDGSICGCEKVIAPTKPSLSPEIADLVSRMREYAKRGMRLMLSHEEILQLLDALEGKS